VKNKLNKLQVHLCSVIEHCKNKSVSLSRFQKLMFSSFAVFILFFLVAILVSGILNAYPYTPAGGATITTTNIWEIVDGITRLIVPSDVNISGNLNVSKNLNVENNLNVFGNITGKKLEVENLSVNGQVNIEGNSKMRVTKNTTQTIPTNTDTKIQYSDEVFDTLNEYDNVTNYRFTAKNAGYYDVRAMVLTDAYIWTAGQIIVLKLYKNGVQYSHLYRNEIETTETYFMNPFGSDIVYLDVNDYVEIYIKHERGADTNLLNAFSLSNYFSVHRIN
jgi:hypothetical protein